MILLSNSSSDLTMIFSEDLADPLLEVEPEYFDRLVNSYVSGEITWEEALTAYKNRYEQAKAAFQGTFLNKVAAYWALPLPSGPQRRFEFLALGRKDTVNDTQHLQLRFKSDNLRFLLLETFPGQYNHIHGLQKYMDQLSTLVDFDSSKEVTKLTAEWEEVFTELFNFIKEEANGNDDSFLRFLPNQKGVMAVTIEPKVQNVDITFVTKASLAPLAVVSATPLEGEALGALYERSQAKTDRENEAVNLVHADFDAAIKSNDPRKVLALANAFTFSGIAENHRAILKETGNLGSSGINPRIIGQVGIVAALVLTAAHSLSKAELFSNDYRARGIEKILK